MWDAVDLTGELPQKIHGGRFPKHIKKHTRLTDPWRKYRPLQRTWECEKCKFQIKRDPDLETLDVVCSCGGKFIRTLTVESAKIDQYTEYGWIIFLESRKGRGREQFLEVQSILLEKELIYEDGWVPYQVIIETINKKCPISRTQLDRLMEDMEIHHIVSKKKEKDTKVKTINKNRIFYKYNIWAAVRTMTPEGYKKEYSRLFTQNLDLSHKYIHATAVLNRHGLMQEYYDELKKWENREGYS